MFLLIESQHNLRRAVCVSPPLLNTVSLRTHGIRNIQTKLQSAVVQVKFRARSKNVKHREIVRAVRDSPATRD